MIKFVISGNNGNKFVTHKSLQVEVNSLKQSAKEYLSGHW